jgi:cbb3-type cytochrome oxidase maturation protein
LEILYLLISLSVILFLVVLGIFGWAVWRDQFEEVEKEGARILVEDGAAVDAMAASSRTTKSTAAQTLDVGQRPR